MKDDPLDCMEELHWSPVYRELMRPTPHWYPNVTNDTYGGMTRHQDECDCGGKNTKEQLHADWCKTKKKES